MIHAASVRTRVIASIVFVFLAMPSRAHAYVDPGLGGQLFQMVYLIVIGVVGFVIAPLLLFGRTVMRIARRAVRRRGVRSSGDSPMTPPNA